MLHDKLDLIFQEPKYENYSEVVPGAAFDSVWTIAIGLDVASKKILINNETGCEGLPGDLVPLEHFQYTNMKLGCVIKQSFSELNFLGITVGCKLILIFFHFM